MLEWILIAVAVIVVLAIVSAVIGQALVRRGRRAPFIIRRLNAASDAVIDTIKRPLTIAILDEVVDVIQTGHYTQNISAALIENHDELKDLVADKLRNDPNVRLPSKLPGYDLLVGEVTETAMRVIISALADPRMDELVSDLLRNNIQQIREAVRERDADDPKTMRPPGVPPPAASTSTPTRPSTPTIPPGPGAYSG